jgi:hypothetical protein
MAYCYYLHTTIYINKNINSLHNLDVMYKKSPSQGRVLSVLDAKALMLVLIFLK